MHYQYCGKPPVYLALCKNSVQYKNSQHGTSSSPMWHRLVVHVNAVLDTIACMLALIHKLLII